MSARHRDRVGDLHTLRRLLDGFERRGYPVDRPTVTALAQIVTAWTPTRSVDITTLAREGYASGKSMTTIASELGVDRRTIADWTSGMPRRFGRGHRVPDEARQRVLELLAAGHTHAAAAQEAGISQSTVSRLASKRTQIAA